MKARLSHCGIVTLFILGGLAAPAIATTGEDEPITFSGRVVEFEKDRPIAGVEIVSTTRLIRGSDAPVEIQTTRSDAEGRFTLKLRPDRKDGLRHELALSFCHPDYIPRNASSRSLDQIFKELNEGEKPFFDKVTLEPGVEYSAVVLRPDGSPAANVPFWIENWQWGHQVRLFSDENHFKTDSLGRVRFRTRKTRSLALYVTPEDAEPFQHYWGFAQPQAHPEFWVPNDLGRIDLKPGLLFKGRVLDLSGQAIAGLRLEAKGRGTRDERTTTTDREGRFQFPPMRPGSYTVRAEGQGQSAHSYNPTDRTIPVTSYVIGPRKAVLKRGVETPFLELREVETVTVSARFVDSSGRATRGNLVAVGGIMGQGEVEVGELAPPAPDADSILAINQDPQPDRTTDLQWGTQIDPDAEGKVSIRVPKGLLNGHMSVQPVTGNGGETLTVKTRLKPGGPLRFWGSASLNELKADVTGIEFIVFRPASLTVIVVRDDGLPLPEGVEVSETWEGETGGSYGGGRGFVRKKDGRFVHPSLIPEQLLEIRAFAQGFTPATSDLISLPEGGRSEITLTLTQNPEPAKVGDLAPPLFVKAIHGTSHSLVDYQGKFVLLSLWAPGFFQQDMVHLKAIHKKYEDNPRFAMLGLSFAFYDHKLDECIKTEKILWPQVRFRRPLQSFMDAYGLQSLPNNILIGPDGTILAKDLRKGDIEAAIKKHLK